ncbi:CGNR zinc finger domain-containing protein [Motilibacter deserti]|uniref:CGNR zinc finger domain-containing protein n=1 Tax=Motilibacter deserti TaxID=2714956 RepID=A0ABX0GVB4_9ACTN|nr:CGNR zinc finger domain-containing protein [Motilibacter deserti]NHC13592.1 CGNR zinc finger domain-containing protein [Motilibacter deserti]
MSDAGTGAPPSAAPEHATLVRAFVNTLDVDEGTDALADAAGLSRWLASNDLLGADDEVADDDLAVARDVRAGLRAALVGHGEAAHGLLDPAEATRAVAVLDGLAARLPLHVSFAGGTPDLVAGGEGARAALAQVLVAAARSGADGSWDRLKICPDDTCAWAFFDESRNRSRAWCGSGCANKNKVRAYRSRKRAADTTAPA